MPDSQAYSSATHSFVMTSTTMAGIGSATMTSRDRFRTRTAMSTSRLKAPRKLAENAAVTSDNAIPKPSADATSLLPRRLLLPHRTSSDSKRLSSTRPPSCHMDNSWGQAGKLSAAGNAVPASSVPVPKPALTKQPRDSQLRPPKPRNGPTTPTLALPRPAPSSSRSITPSNASRASRLGAPKVRTPSTTSSVASTAEPDEIDIPAAMQPTETVEDLMTSAGTKAIYPELDRYRNICPPAITPTSTSGPSPPPTAQSDSPLRVPRIQTHELYPPTPLYSGSGSQGQLSGLSATPSTHFSASPATCLYSRDTTPTSMCSQSPGLAVSVRGSALRMRQPSVSPSSTRPSPTTVKTPSSTKEPTVPLLGEPFGSFASRATSNASSPSNVPSMESKRRVEKSPLKPHVSALLASPIPSPVVSNMRNSRKGVDDTPPKASGRHLDHATVTTSSPVRSIPAAGSRGPQKPATLTGSPARPSRDGTDGLDVSRAPMPVIQSNLPALTSLRKRQGKNTNSFTSVRPVTSLPRFNSSSNPKPPESMSGREPAPTSSPAPSSAPSPAPSITGTSTSYPAQSMAPAHAPPVSLPVQERLSANDATRECRPVQPPSPALSALRVRFPLFNRRKTDVGPESCSSTTENPSGKSTRRGPSAGTGHEGYGKLALIRRRTGSSSSISSKKLASPNEMTAATDSYFLSRVNPVVIVGGEVVENQNLPKGRDQGHDSSLAANSGAERDEGALPKLLNNGSLTHGEARSLGVPAESSKLPREDGDESQNMLPQPKSLFGYTLAQRRSFSKLHLSSSAVKIPKPILTTMSVPSSCTTSYDSTCAGALSAGLEVPPTPVEPLFTTKTLNSSNGQKKPTKKAGRWNLFGRNQPKQPPESPPQVVPATVSVGHVETYKKAVPFYAMMDLSEQEDNDTSNSGISPEHEIQPCTAVPRYLQGHMPSMSAGGPLPRRAPTSGFPFLYHNPHGEAGSARKTEQDLPASSSMLPPANAGITEHGNSSAPLLSELLRPSPARRRSASDGAVQSAVPAPVCLKFPILDEPATETSPKPVRLQHVGRIPKVIRSNRSPSASSISQTSRSFSRPFTNNRSQDYGSVSIVPAVTGPAPLDASLQDLAPIGSALASPTNTPEVAQTTVSITTPSAGCINRDLITANAAVTVPAAGHTTELFSFVPAQTAGSTCDSSFSSCSSYPLSYAATTAIIPGPETPFDEDEIWEEYDDLIGIMPASATNSCGVVSPPEAWPNSVPVKNSRVVSMSRQYFSERNGNFAGTAGACNAAQLGSVLEAHEGDMNAEPLSLQPNRSSTEGKARHSAHRNSTASRVSHRTSASSRLTAEDDSPLAQVNLRVGSMTVSKWLTFGNVLFSPIRDELDGLVTGSRPLSPSSRPSLKDAPTTKPATEVDPAAQSNDSDPNRPSILIIDGLGNDDWAFYAAETYPGATFFNLSPCAPLSTEQKHDTIDSCRSSSPFPLTPPNHHQVQYLDATARFPFGPDSFSCVVYRFPVAAPRAHYNNIISEARRVLKPGGYLELSILDVDFNNMGNRSRRAVRALKERMMKTVDGGVNLASAADLVLKVLNRRGFSDVKTCHVGVPVGALSCLRSSTSSSTGGAKDAGAGLSEQWKSNQHQSSHKRKKDPLEQRSLADMMSDTSAVADKQITNMVSHVGRWWYSKCYESAAGVDSENSMWRNKALLEECRLMGTSLKLMVCYARVPDKGGRVVSI